MKKSYIYPTVESVKVNAQVHLCDASPAADLGGGNIPGDPNDNL